MITARRISEEFQNGKTVKASFREGFNRSLYPIVNSTVICGVGALILFLLTSGQLKGLAITLGIGSVVSIISTLLFTRMFTNLILAVAKNKEALFNLKRKED